MVNYKNTTENKDRMGYTNTDFILKSIITSMDLIEIDEIKILIEPQVYIYLYYAKVNALYSKAHFYIDNSFKIEKKSISVDDELRKIKKRLYNKKFLNDIKLSNERKNYNKESLVEEYNLIAERTTDIYRHMTYEFSRLGMFFPIIKEIKTPGVVR